MSNSFLPIVTLLRRSLPVLAVLVLSSLVSCEMVVAPPSDTSGLDSGGAPNLAGTYRGSYTYGADYGSRAGESVPFSVTISQAPGSNVFTGVMNEPYSGFGTPVNGRLWADISGTCRAGAGRVSVAFQKEYRTVDQPAVGYRGSVSSGGGTLSGSWVFPDDARMSGTFVIEGLQP